MKNVISYRKLLYDKKVKMIKQDKKTQFSDFCNIFKNEKNNAIGITRYGSYNKYIHEIPFLELDDGTYDIIISELVSFNAIYNFSIDNTNNIVSYINKISFYRKVGFDLQLLKTNDNIDDVNNILNMNVPIIFGEHHKNFIWLVINVSSDIFQLNSELRIYWDQCIFKGFNDIFKSRNNEIDCGDYICRRGKPKKKVTLDDIDDEKINLLFKDNINQIKVKKFIIKLSKSGMIDLNTMELQLTFYTKANVYIKNEFDMIYDASKYILFLNGYENEDHSVMDINNFLEDILENEFSLYYKVKKDKLQNDNIHGQLYLCFDLYYKEREI